MTKDKIKNISDFIPLAILTISAIILTYKVIATDALIIWKHIAGFIFLPVNYFLFRWQHKIGVLSLGLTLFTGLAGLISYNHAIVTASSYINFGDIRIPVFYGQPIFLLWLLLHFIVSGRHYLGIGTKSYWQEILSKETGGTC